MGDTGAVGFRVGEWPPRASGSGVPTVRPSSGNGRSCGEPALSGAFELRIPAARGQCPYAPGCVYTDRRGRHGIEHTEQWESRFRLLEAFCHTNQRPTVVLPFNVPGDHLSNSVVRRLARRVGKRTPHLALGAGGARDPLLGDGAHVTSCVLPYPLHRLMCRCSCPHGDRACLAAWQGTPRDRARRMERASEPHGGRSHRSAIRRELRFAFVLA